MQTDLAAIVNLNIDTIETYQQGKCVGMPPEHQTQCTNQTSLDSYCDCLTDAANHCAKAHDENWWKFTACTYVHNGRGTASGTGLSDDSTFETALKTCSQQLASYSFDDLKACYTGSEGSAYIYNSEQLATKAGAEHPTWMYVGTTLVDGNMFEDIEDWASQVVKTICSTYTGASPASCSSKILV
jgi:hypothetical protein